MCYQKWTPKVLRKVNISKYYIHFSLSSCRVLFGPTRGPKQARNPVVGNPQFMTTWFWYINFNVIFSNWANDNTKNVYLGQLFNCQFTFNLMWWSIPDGSQMSEFEVFASLALCLACHSWLFPIFCQLKNKFSNYRKTLRRRSVLKQLQIFSIEFCEIPQESVAFNCHGGWHWITVLTD